MFSTVDDNKLEPVVFVLVEDLIAFASSDVSVLEEDLLLAAAAAALAAAAAAALSAPDLALELRDEEPSACMNASDSCDSKPFKKFKKFSNFFFIF